MRSVHYKLAILKKSNKASAYCSTNLYKILKLYTKISDPITYLESNMIILKFQPFAIFYACLYICALLCVLFIIMSIICKFYMMYILYKNVAKSKERKFLLSLNVQILQWLFCTGLWNIEMHAFTVIYSNCLAPWVNFDHTEQYIW